MYLSTYLSIYLATFRGLKPHQSPVSSLHPTRPHPGPPSAPRISNSFSVTAFIGTSARVARRANFSRMRWAAGRMGEPSENLLISMKFIDEHLFIWTIYDHMIWIILWVYIYIHVYIYTWFCSMDIYMDVNGGYGYLCGYPWISMVLLYGCHI